MTEVASSGVVSTLGLNLNLFIAQLLNFGVIMFVLQRWVWRPLVKTMEERQATIAAGLAQAEQAAEQVKALAARERAVLAEAEKSGQTIIEEARQAAENERRQIMQETQHALETQLAEARERLKLEREAVFLSVKREVSSLVALAVERVVGEAFQGKREYGLIDAAIKDLEKHPRV